MRRTEIPTELWERVVTLLQDIEAIPCDNGPAVEDILFDAVGLLEDIECAKIHGIGP